MSNSEMNTEEIQSSNLIADLRFAINGGTSAILDVPLLIARIIKTAAWRERFVEQTKEKIVFSSLEEFITTAQPEGLGTTTKKLQQLCVTDLSVLDLLDRTLKPKKHGGDRKSTTFKSDNVTVEMIDTNRGNSAVYSLRRLRAARPDLHAHVLAKKLSINQAMISAGLRRKTITVTADIDKLYETIQANFNSDQIKELIEKLQKPS